MININILSLPEQMRADGSVKKNCKLLNEACRAVYPGVMQRLFSQDLFDYPAGLSILVCRLGPSNREPLGQEFPELCAG